MILRTRKFRPETGVTRNRRLTPGARCTTRRGGLAFTLIELILVMAILTMMVSVSAPTLSHFFRGRTLDSEARRMLSLLRAGQSRAVAEGVPMDFWVDAAQGRFGLEAERSYEPEDPKAVELPIDGGLQIEVGNATNAPAATPLWPGQSVSTASISKVALARPTLPTIRFLPDGSIGDSSPLVLSLRNSEGASLLVAQARNRLTYEIRVP
jgi:type II secretory pathway pseudopilin PulG